jgi:hypothetical protein
LQVTVNDVGRVDGGGEAVGDGDGEGEGDGGASSKVAVTVPGPLIVAVVSIEAWSAIVIDPVVIQESKTYPASAVADIGTFAPESLQLSAKGVTVPYPAGLLVNDTRYWVFQLAVSVMGLFIVTECDVTAPLYEPVPLPVQAVRRY